LETPFLLQRFVLTEWLGEERLELEASFSPGPVTTTEVSSVAVPIGPIVVKSPFATTVWTTAVVEATLSAAVWIATSATEAASITSAAEAATITSSAKAAPITSAAKWTSSAGASSTGTSARAHAWEKARGWLRWSRHTPAEFSQAVRTLEKTSLISKPLVASEKTTECSVKLVGIDLLVCIDNISQDFANLLRHFSGLAHIYGCGFKVGSGISERQASKSLPKLGSLEGCNKYPALTFLASTTRATEAMDVSVAITRKANLDNMSDIGKIHSTCGDIGREHDTW
jgi:hypothetical protein